MSRRWHKGSVFGPGRRRPLDRNGRARFRYLLRAHARARRLAPKQQWVGEALVKRLGADGQCDPSYETLAEDAGCSARTARRATARMWELGLLLWQKRLIRTEWRAEQTSNAYELLTGDELLAPAAAPVISCGGQSGRGTAKKEITLVGIEAEHVAAPVLQAQLLPLEEIAKRREAAINAAWLAKRGQRPR